MKKRMVLAALLSCVPSSYAMWSEKLQDGETITRSEKIGVCIRVAKYAYFVQSLNPETGTICFSPPRLIECLPIYYSINMQTTNQKRVNVEDLLRQVDRDLKEKFNCGKEFYLAVQGPGPSIEIYTTGFISLGQMWGNKFVKWYVQAKEKS